MKRRQSNEKVIAGRDQQWRKSSRSKIMLKSRIALIGSLLFRGIFNEGNSQGRFAEFNGYVDNDKKRSANKNNIASWTLEQQHYQKRQGKQHYQLQNFILSFRCIYWWKIKKEQVNYYWTKEYTYILLFSLKQDVVSTCAPLYLMPCKWNVSSTCNSSELIQIGMEPLRNKQIFTYFLNCIYVIKRSYIYNLFMYF